MSKRLHAAGLLTEIDVAAFTVYCVAWGQYVEAQEKLKSHGAVIIGPSNFPVLSPYVALANKAAEQLMRAAVEFGMTPSSRSRVPAGPILPGGTSSVARFFEEQSRANNPAAKWFGRQ